MSRTSRSLWVTLLASAMMLLGALLTPISVIAVAMVLVGSDGTQSVDLLEGAAVVLGPPLTLVCGIGLWRRTRWAWWGTVLLLTTTLLVDLGTLVRGPTPEHSYVSASGVRTTVSATDTGYAGPSVVVCAALLAILFYRRRRGEFAPVDAVAKTSPPASPSPPPAAMPQASYRLEPTGKAGHSSAWLVAALLLALAGGMFWLVGSGLHRGQTVWPSKSPSQQRAIARAEEPTKFWFAIGLYGVIGAGALGLIAWGAHTVRQGVPRAVREPPRKTS